MAVAREGGIGRRAVMRRVESSGLIQRFNLSLVSIYRVALSDIGAWERSDEHGARGGVGVWRRWAWGDGGHASEYAWLRWWSFLLLHLPVVL